MRPRVVDLFLHVYCDLKKNCSHVRNNISLVMLRYNCCMVFLCTVCSWGRR